MTKDNNNSAPVKPKKQKKKDYMGDDNEEFFKELDKNGPYPPSEERQHEIDRESFMNLIKVINYRAFA